MGRNLRSQVVGNVFHVVNRGVARTTIFFDDEDRIEFERLISVAAERHDIEVIAYCWMTNHFHLIASCPSGGLSESMHLVGSVYVRHFNQRHGRDGPLFRSRFVARPIRSDAYLWQATRYVHRNPLAFVDDDGLLEYRWSSLRVYAEQRRTPTWMGTAAVAGDADDRAAVVRAALGDVAGDTVTDPDDWESIVHLAIDEHLPDRHAIRSRRTLSTLLLERLDSERRAPIEAALAFPTRQAQTAAVYRARRRLATTPGLGLAVDTALDLAS